MQCADILEDYGFVSVRTTNFGTDQWVRGKRRTLGTQWGSINVTSGTGSKRR